MHSASDIFRTQSLLLFLVVGYSMCLFSLSVILIYWYYCCWSGLVLVCLSFKVHCFTFVRFIYRSLPVTDKNRTEKKRITYRLVTLQRKKPTNWIFSVSWAFMKMFTNFMGRTWINYDLIWLDQIIHKILYRHKERISNAIWLKTLVCLMISCRQQTHTLEKKKLKVIPVSWMVTRCSNKNLWLIISSRRSDEIVCTHFDSDRHFCFAICTRYIPLA